MQVPYSPSAVANFFLRIGQDQNAKLTQMKLHKLLYYAHGWHLAFTESPLLDEMIEAWQYGPVVPSVYQEFKDLGSQPIGRFAVEWREDSRGGLRSIEPQIEATDPVVPAFLTRIWDVYGKFTAAQLSRMTHVADGPWEKTRRKYPGIHGVDIQNEDIRDYFKERLADGRT